MKGKSKYRCKGCGKLLELSKFRQHFKKCYASSVKIAKQNNNYKINKQFINE